MKDWKDIIQLPNDKQYNKFLKNLEAMENSIELLETNNFTLSYDCEAERTLEHEFDILLNGKKLTVVADVYVEYIEENWYEDEYGYTQSDVNLESLSVDIITSYDEDDNEDVLTKQETIEIEEFLTKELKLY
jgi:hypothetical protein